MWLMPPSLLRALLEALFLVSLVIVVTGADAMP
jgi:hypothetical protein